LIAARLRRRRCCCRRCRHLQLQASRAAPADALHGVPNILKTLLLLPLLLLLLLLLS
jgi:hypothetical protein